MKENKKDHHHLHNSYSQNPQNVLWPSNVVKTTNVLHVHFALPFYNVLPILLLVFTPVH